MIEFEDVTDFLGSSFQSGIGLAVSNWGLIILGVVVLLSLVVGGFIFIKLFTPVALLLTFKQINYSKCKRLN